MTVEYAAHRDEIRRLGVTGMQADFARSEAQATRIAKWQPAMMPGLLQTPAYTRELLALSFNIIEADAVEQVVAARLDRQSRLLYETGRMLLVNCCGISPAWLD